MEQKSTVDDESGPDDVRAVVSGVGCREAGCLSFSRTVILGDDYLARICRIVLTAGFGAVEMSRRSVGGERSEEKNEMEGEGRDRKRDGQTTDHRGLIIRLYDYD